MYRLTLRHIVKNGRISKKLRANVQFAFDIRGRAARKRFTNGVIEE